MGNEAAKKAETQEEKKPMNGDAIRWSSLAKLLGGLIAAGIVATITFSINAKATMVAQSKDIESVSRTVADNVERNEATLGEIRSDLRSVENRLRGIEINVAAINVKLNARGAGQPEWLSHFIEGEWPEGTTVTTTGDGLYSVEIPDPKKDR